MSKRVQRYECDACGSSYRDKTEAEDCEKQHVEAAASERRERAWDLIADKGWRLTETQIEEVASLFESWGIEGVRAASRQGPQR